MISRSFLLIAVRYHGTLAVSIAVTRAGVATAHGQAHRPAWARVGVDTTARLLASRLSARWGKPVVIENRPGSDGFVAIGAFTGARDDHTLLFTPTSSFTAHPFLYDKLPYDPRDLVPIARVTNTLAGVGVTALLEDRVAA